MNNLFYILKKELRELFRDKKSLSMMLIIPIMIPLLVIGMSALFDMQSNRSIEEYNRIGFDYTLSEMEQNIAKELHLEVIEQEKNQLEEEYHLGNLDLYVTKEDNLYILHGDENETTSYAKSLMNQYFSIYKEYLQNEYLMQKEITADEVTQIIKVEENINQKENFFASYITTYGFLFLIMAITVSATYPATDTTAGEKERGTLETLMTFPIKSKDIILGKFLSVSFSSIITGFISFLLFLGSLYLSNHMFKIYEGVNLMLSLESIAFSVVVIFAYSFLISGLCISIASKSKSFKEAQSALTPLTFLSFFPSMIAFMIDIKSSILLSCIPFLNFTLLFEDIVAGKVEMINLFVMLVSTIVLIYVILTFIIKQYKSEKILF